MSEKLDGVRAVWGGKKMLSKQGIEIRIPDRILAQLPSDLMLDGELYAGRGNFERVISALAGGSWDGVNFVAFDIISDEKAIDRKEKLQSCGYAHVLSFQVCENKRHLKEFEECVKKNGGEGVMLLRRSSKYLEGRTTNLLKVKRASVDKAIVLGWNGKSLDVSFCGIEFSIGIGIKSSWRLNPPKEGSEILFSFYGKTANGVPRHAAIFA